MSDQFYIVGIESEPREDVYNMTTIHIGKEPAPGSYYIVVEDNILSLYKYGQKSRIGFYVVPSSNVMLQSCSYIIGQFVNEFGRSLHNKGLLLSDETGDRSDHPLIQFLRYASLYRKTERFDLSCSNENFKKLLIDNDLYDVVDTPTTDKKIIISGTDDNIAFQVVDKSCDLTFNLNPSTRHVVMTILLIIAFGSFKTDELISSIKNIFDREGLCTVPKTDESMSGIEFLMKTSDMFNAFYRILSRWVLYQ
jgi:hypothetical protein